MTSFKIHDVTAPVHAVKLALHGGASLGGGFNAWGKIESPPGWQVNIARSGGTGNHGVAHYQPLSEEAKVQAEAVSSAWQDGIIAVLNATGWRDAAAVLRQVNPPVGWRHAQPALYQLWWSDHDKVVREDRLPLGSGREYNGAGLVPHLVVALAQKNSGGPLPGIYDTHWMTLDVIHAGYPSDHPIWAHLGIDPTSLYAEDDDEEEMATEGQPASRY